MSRRRVIVNTNLVLAGLPTGHKASPKVGNSAGIPDGRLEAALAFVVSEAQPAEYCSGLVWQNLRSMHGLTVA